MGKEKELNTRCAFFVKFKGIPNAFLRITGCSVYKIYLNGKMLAFGPARAAHNCFRVDELPLNDLLDQNSLFIETVGYNTKNFVYPLHSAFLQAEVVANGKPIVWTGKHFKVREYNERVQKVCRFSYQRAFLETYIFSKNPLQTYLDFSANTKKEIGEDPVEVQGGERYLNRRVGYPLYPVYNSNKIETGIFNKVEKEIKLKKRFWLDTLPSFKKEDCFNDPEVEFQKLKYKSKPLNSNLLTVGQFATYNFERIHAGFIKISVRAYEDTRLCLLFDETLSNENSHDALDICFNRFDCLKIIEYNLKPGQYEHISIEPYTARYIRVVVLTGQAEILNIQIVGFENADAERFVFSCQDQRLNAIADAGKSTLKHNAVDVLMDCPSRERAGWLCDAYFTGQAEKLLTGNNKTERAFLENYVYAPDSLSLGLPQGMVPCCYPADFEDGLYITNWAFYYILELESYSLRNNDLSILKESKQKVLGIVEFFSKRENEFGLLEKLNERMFVDYSDANSYFLDVNYPTNMLYAKALESVGRLYGNFSLFEKADKIRNQIRKESFDGEFFHDNSVRKNGVLTRTDNISEACQYYAFFSQTATPEKDPQLYQKLINDFGPLRDAKNIYPNISKANAYTGFCLRFILLNKFGERQKVLQETASYFYPMANNSGTLWEVDDASWSLTHGYASFAVNVIVNALCGFEEARGNTLYFYNSSSNLDCCLQLPIGDDIIWFERKNGKETLCVPDGYKVERI